jgi:hypothetical protein
MEILREGFDARLKPADEGQLRSAVQRFLEAHDLTGLHRRPRHGPS